MGRPEGPLAGPPHRRRFARRLRELRAEAGVTYDEMAAVAAVSPSTLKRAASGAVLPKWITVVHFYIACFAAAAHHTRPIPKVAELEKLWRTARMEERGTLHLKNPRPEYIADQADLSHALYALYERAGAPPLRQVQRQGGEPLHLPLSTLARIVNRETLPADQKQYLAFLVGCGVPEEQRVKWLAAWKKSFPVSAAILKVLTEEEELRRSRGSPAGAAT
ncbi:helix-turn-helix domain-containing protein [Streptomyces sp. NPDC094153]|uniref:helix-turn-helix domain-containing protein n=1 Tax=Streptomyces sp. NPDC094153 TaxID=3366058 RepID=UPI00382FDC0C